MGLGEEARTKAKAEGGTYSTVMDPDQYADLFRNVNPYTAGTMNTLNSLLGQYSNPTMPTFQSGWGQQLNNLMSAEKRSGDLNYFTNQVMPGIYGGLAAPKAEAQGYIGDLVAEQLSAAAPQWANTNSKYSGANLESRNKIAGEIARQVGYDVSKDINAQGASLAGQYLGNMGAMNTAGLGAYSSLYGADTSRYASDLGAYNSQLGFAGTLASNLAGLSAPDMIAPELEYNPTLKELRKQNWAQTILPTITGLGGLAMGGISALAPLLMGGGGGSAAAGGGPGTIDPFFAQDTRYWS